MSRKFKWTLAFAVLLLFINGLYKYYSTKSSYEIIHPKYGVVHEAIYGLGTVLSSHVQSLIPAFFQKSTIGFYGQSSIRQTRRSKALVCQKANPTLSNRKSS